MPSIDLFKPQITSAQACTVAGISMGTLKNWAARGVLVLEEQERVAIGDKTSFQFTIASVLQMAIVAALVGLDVPPGRAGEIAWTYTETDGISGGPDHPGACELYPTGKTLLVAGAQSCEVMNVHGKDSLYSFLARLGSGAVVLDLNQIRGRVLAQFGGAN